MSTAALPSLENWIAQPYSGAGFNIRRAAYITSAILIPGSFFVAWTLIALGVIAPMPADKYVSACLFVGYWMALFAFVDNPGESRTLTQKWHEFLMVWLITSGCAQVMWEIPVVYMKIPFLYDLGSELQRDEWMFWPWWLYAVADTRYMRPHDGQLAHEMMLSHFGFFELLAAYWLSKGIHYKKALGIAVLANWGAFYGNTSVIYISEILGDFRYIEDGPLGFWLKFVGLNLQWSTVSPAAAMGAIWLLGQRSRAEALAETGAGNN
jgi:hypothetical protein